jgi:hypothetical protein
MRRTTPTRPRAPSGPIIRGISPNYEYVTSNFNGNTISDNQINGASR